MSDKIIELLSREDLLDKIKKAMDNYIAVNALEGIEDADINQKFSEFIKKYSALNEKYSAFIEKYSAFIEKYSKQPKQISELNTQVKYIKKEYIKLNKQISEQAAEITEKIDEINTKFDEIIGKVDEITEKIDEIPEDLEPIESKKDWQSMIAATMLGIGIASIGEIWKNKDLRKIIVTSIVIFLISISIISILNMFTFTHKFWGGRIICLYPLYILALTAICCLILFGIKKKKFPNTANGTTTTKVANLCTFLAIFIVLIYEPSIIPQIFNSGADYKMEQLTLERNFLILWASEGRGNFIYEHDEYGWVRYEGEYKDYQPNGNNVTIKNNREDILYRGNIKNYVRDGVAEIAYIEIKDESCKLNGISGYAGDPKRPATNSIEARFKDDVLQEVTTNWKFNALDNDKFPHLSSYKGEFKGIDENFEGNHENNTISYGTLFYTVDYKISSEKGYFENGDLTSGIRKYREDLDYEILSDDGAFENGDLTSGIRTYTDDYEISSEKGYFENGGLTSGIRKHKYDLGLEGIHDEGINYDYKNLGKFEGALKDEVPKWGKLEFVNQQKYISFEILKDNFISDEPTIKRLELSNKMIISADEDVDFTSDFINYSLDGKYPVINITDIYPNYSSFLASFRDGIINEASINFTEGEDYISYEGGVNHQEAVNFIEGSLTYINKDIFDGTFVNNLPERGKLEFSNQEKFISFEMPDDTKKILELINGIKIQVDNVSFETDFQTLRLNEEFDVINIEEDYPEYDKFKINFDNGTIKEICIKFKQGRYKSYKGSAEGNNSERFIKDWKRDMYDGYGILTWEHRDTKYTYIGNFSNGLFNDENGRLEATDNSYVQGVFKDGIFKEGEWRLPMVAGYSFWSDTGKWIYNFTDDIKITGIKSGQIVELKGESEEILNDSPTVTLRKGVERYIKFEETEWLY